MVAAHWLVEHDSPALRRLAGLDGRDGWLIDQLWPEVLSDLGVGDVRDEDAWDLLLTYELAALRSGDRSIEDVTGQVIRAYITTEYPPYPPEPAHLCGLDDELQGRWGRTIPEVLAEVERTLVEWAKRRALP